MDKLKVAPEESCFVGDGGSNELFGAKQAGMHTVFTEYLEQKKENRRSQILKSADYSIKAFKQLLDII